MAAFGEKKLTLRQHELLAKHREHFDQMVSYVRECDPEELQELLEACDAHGMTNCGWTAYAAAQFLKNDIRGLIGVRNALASVPNGDL